jgi:hypothetical protein
MWRVRTKFSQAYLEGRSTAQGGGGEVATGTLLVDLVVRVLDGVLVDGFMVLVLHPRINVKSKVTWWRTAALGPGGDPPGSG